MRVLKGGGALLLLIALGVYLNNASWLAPEPDGGIKIIAHRGVHHTYSMEGVGPQTCTADRIYPPTHDYIENTIPSMEAAFAYGADIIELDIHPTTDGEFAVFHDWTLDCRTEGEGVTRKQSMAYLKTLDVGYGYTADGGRTFPLRGKGVGMMPTLAEVLTRFPDRDFMINIKGNDAEEGELLAAYLGTNGFDTERLSVFAAWRPAERLETLLPGLRVLGRHKAKECVFPYLTWGWAGHVPEACANNWLPVPQEYAFAAWGWPRRLTARMEDHGTEVLLIRMDPNGGSAGIDTLEHLAAVPDGFSGLIMTDRIEVIGPALKPSQP